MTRRATLLLFALAAAACGPGSPIPEEELSLRVSAPPAAIELGRGFPLTVVRVWSKDLEPDPWTDDALLPLVVRLEAEDRREDAHRVEETRRFRAYAFEPGKVTVPPVAFSAAPRAGAPNRAERRLGWGVGGASRTASAEGFTLEVKTTLEPKTAGPPELPDLIPEPVRWQLWAAVVAGALAAGALLARASARRARRGVSGPAVATPRDRALARLRRLREQQPRTRDEDLAWHTEAASAVRDWLSEGCAIRSRERTTEELLEAARASPAFAPPQREALAAALRPCDLVKFARHEPRAAERDLVLASAEAAVSGAPRS